MSESRVFLEKRLGIMMRKPARGWRLSTVALGCSSLALIATAAQIEPPNGATGPVIRQWAGDLEAQARSEAPEISYEASTMDSDVKTHQMHLTEVTITFGNMTVKADRAFATSGDFKDSRWTFDGNVRINNVEAHGNLRSDEVVVEFKDNQLKRATATGSTAEFEQRRADSDVIIRGHADEIVYEGDPGTIRLSDAYINDGESVIQAPLLVYSVRKERVGATTSGGGP
jgi:lipopolysaccharide transport protein LptA